MALLCKRVMNWLALLWKMYAIGIKLIQQFFFRQTHGDVEGWQWHQQSTIYLSSDFTDSLQKSVSLHEFTVTLEALGCQGPAKSLSIRPLCIQFRLCLATDLICVTFKLLYCFNDAFSLCGVVITTPNLPVDIVEFKGVDVGVCTAPVSVPGLPFPSCFLMARTKLYLERQSLHDPLSPGYHQHNSGELLNSTLRYSEPLEMSACVQSYSACLWSESLN